MAIAASDLAKDMFRIIDEKGVVIKGWFENAVVQM